MAPSRDDTCAKLSALVHALSPNVKRRGKVTESESLKPEKIQ